MALRAFIRKHIRQIFFEAIHEGKEHFGIGELLEILGSSRPPTNCCTPTMFGLGSLFRFFLHGNNWRIMRNAHFVHVVHVEQL